MKVNSFFDEATSTVTYAVWDEDSSKAVVIDSVADFEPASGRVHHRSCEEVARFIESQGLDTAWVLDTHAHADHLTGMAWLRERLGAKTAIGTRIREVQRAFSALYHLGPDFHSDGRQWDVLLDEGEAIEAGGLRVEAIHSPGHTPACLSYRIGDALFVGDVLFMPDYGTARCDFPGGSAENLYDSVQKLYRLPEATRVFTCHDYRPGGRPLRFESTIGEEKRSNVQLGERTRKADFVDFRRRRDATLELPALMLAALQVNVRAGELPPPEANGVAYLKIPLNSF